MSGWINVDSVPRQKLKPAEQEPRNWGDVTGTPSLDDQDSRRDSVVIDIEDNEVSAAELMLVEEDHTNRKENPASSQESVDMMDNTQDATVTEDLQDSEGTEALPNMEQREITDLKLNKMKETEKQQMEKFNSFKRFSVTDRIFPDLRLSKFHTILFTLSANFKLGDALVPYPPSYINSWNKDYVPMPCDPENTTLIRTTNTNEGSEDDRSMKRMNMWTQIQRTLAGYRFFCCQDIGTCMRNYFKRVSNLNALQYAVEQLMSNEERDNFLSGVLPAMANYCLQLPQLVTSPIPLLKRERNYSISFSQEQIIAILSNAFFSTFPRRLEKDGAYPSINFNELFACAPDDPRIRSRANKIRCILHYFERVTKSKPKGIVTFTRRSIGYNNMPRWNESLKPLTKIAVLCDGTIEDTGSRTLKVDFANRFLGGGVLGRGAVQEEILFVIYPELIVSRLITENLGPNEALLITGCERFSTYKGYASGFTYDGDYQDSVPCDSKGRKITQLVAIDALHFNDPLTQFNPRCLIRELNKAFVGFSIPYTPVAIASGRWGCGAFKGDPVLKAVLQLMAASEAGRDLTYFAFGDIDLQEVIIKLYDSIKHMPIKEILSLLKQYHSVYCASGSSSLSLVEFFNECRIPTNFMDSDGSQETQEIQPITPSNFYSSANVSINSVQLAAAATSSSKTYITRPTSTPSSNSTTPRRENPGSSKNNVSWLKDFDKFKASFKGTKVEVSKKPDVLSLDDFPPLSANPGNLTNDQISQMLTKSDDDESEPMDIVVNHEQPSTTNTKGHSNSMTGKPFRRKPDPDTESAASSPEIRNSAKKIATSSSSGTKLRQSTLFDFYEK